MTAEMEDRWITRVSFLAERTADLKKLAGWKNTFRIPDRMNDSSMRFVAEVAAGEVKADLDAVYQSLKEAFRFTRRELAASEPGDGTGTITTPSFSYSLNVALHSVEPPIVSLRRTVDEIRDASQVESKAFGKVFDNVFDSLRLSLPNEVEVTDFIDAVENLDSPEIAVAYDRACTYCDLQVKGVTGALRLTPSALSLVYERPKGAKYLFQAMQSVKALIDKHEVPLISFAPTKKK